MLRFDPLISPLISVAVFLLLVGAIVIGYRRLAGVERRRRALLCMLRLLFALGLLTILLNPYMMRDQAPVQSVELAVCVDGSASMAAGPAGRTRHERAVAWIGDVLPGWDAGVTRVYGFDETLHAVDTPGALQRGENGTRMYRALVQLLNAEANRSPAAVVLLSDGISSVDKGLQASVIRQFRTRGIPVYTVQADDGESLADIRVVSVVTPEILADTKEIPLSVRIDSAGFGGTTVPLVVRRGTREVVSKSVLLDGQPQDVHLTLPAASAGDYICSVELGTPRRDMAPGNNRAAFGYTVVREKIRVLYMEGSPKTRWIPLKNALEEDPAFEVKALQRGYYANPMAPYHIGRAYRHPGSDEVVYHVAHPTGGYPLTMKAMLEYDVIINSDIPKICFTPDSLHNTTRFVEEFGGGFVMIGGNSSFGAGGYNTTAIEKIIPVAMEVEKDTVWQEFKLTYPDGIFDHPLMAIGDETISAEAVWREKLPSFMGVNRVDRTKPAATLLATCDRLRNQWGPLVVLASQDIGRGRTLAFTSDTTPDWGILFQERWGERTGNGTDRRYYKRFWHNAMRWLSAGKAMRAHGPLILDSMPRVWRQDEPQILRARLYDAETMIAAPAGQARISFRSPTSSHETTLTFDALRGYHTAHARIDTPGTYRVEGILQDSAASRVDLGSVTVMPSNEELQELRGDDAALTALAQGTGGAFFRLSDKEALARELAQLVPGTTTSTEAVYPWHSWYVLILLAALLTAEWLIRRSSGLV